MRHLISSISLFTYTLSYHIFIRKKKPQRSCSMIWLYSVGGVWQELFSNPSTGSSRHMSINSRKLISFVATFTKCSINRFFATTVTPRVSTRSSTATNFSMSSSDRSISPSLPRLSAINRSAAALFSTRCILLGDNLNFLATSIRRTPAFRICRIRVGVGLPAC